MVLLLKIAVAITHANIKARNIYATAEFAWLNDITYCLRKNICSEEQVLDTEKIINIVEKVKSVADDIYQILNCMLLLWN